MSKKEKAVELIPDGIAASGWKVKHDGKQGDKPQDYPKIVFAKDSGPHLVTFTLPQNTSATFNQDDPIWIAKGTTSPSAKGIDPQFSDWAIFDGGKTLVLLNKNFGPAAEYSYRVKADNYAKILDPIIENKGGIGGVIDPPEIGPGGGYSESQYITAAAIALLVGILIGFVVHKMLFSSRPVG